jgi:hypothetical protein
VEDLALLKGMGWLRVRGSASAAASYRLNVRRCDSGALHGRIEAEGLLSANLSTMLDAEHEGGATLVLADGAPVAVRMIHVGPFHGAFQVIGRVPGY